MNIKSTDPVKKIMDSDLESLQHTPMNPPDPFTYPIKNKIPVEKLDNYLKKLMEEHKVCLQKLKDFEMAFIEFKKEKWFLNQKINFSFKDFFTFFDQHIIPHNQREEKQLFPVLQKKLISSKEHSLNKNPITAVTLLEDDHIKVIQTGSLIFNFLGLAPRLPDNHSREIVFNFAFDQARDLVESIKHHIYREDEIAFQLAQQLISPAEFVKMTESGPDVQ